jgi:hypothetical protein
VLCAAVLHTDSVETDDALLGSLADELVLSHGLVPALALQEGAVVKVHEGAGVHLWRDSRQADRGAGGR